MREAKSIEEAKAKWKKDYKLEPGESLVLQPKTMTREAAVEFYEKMREFPNVANRVAPQKPPPYEQTGFRETHKSPPPPSLLFPPHSLAFEISLLFPCPLSSRYLPCRAHLCNMSLLCLSPFNPPCMRALQHVLRF